VVKKVPVMAGAFLCPFSGAFEGGFLENARFSDGIFVVKLWWICGKSW
jgi:hypothetical protein